MGHALRDKAPRHLRKTVIPAKAGIQTGTDLTRQRFLLTAGRKGLYEPLA